MTDNERFIFSRGLINLKKIHQTHKIPEKGRKKIKKQKYEEVLSKKILLPVCHKAKMGGGIIFWI